MTAAFSYDDRWNEEHPISILYQSAIILYIWTLHPFSITHIHFPCLICCMLISPKSKARCRFPSLSKKPQLKLGGVVFSAHIRLPPGFSVSQKSSQRSSGRLALWDPCSPQKNRGVSSKLVNDAYHLKFSSMWNNVPFWEHLSRNTDVAWSRKNHI